MLTEQRERSGAKIVLLLGAVCVVGLALGWITERIVSDEASEEEMEQAYALDTGVAVPPIANGPSEWESEVIHRATLGLPPYPGADPHALAADFLGPKVPISAAWFTTRDTPDAVLDWYRGQFYDAGVPSTQERPGPNGGYIAYMVPISGVIRSVTATRQGKETVVLVSNGDMAPLLDGTQDVPDDVPHPKDAEDTMVLRMNQEGAGDVTVSANLPGHDLGAWTDFYRSGFEEKGWKVDQLKRPTDAEALVEVTQAGRHGSAYLKRDDGESRIQVLVRVSEAPGGTR